MRTSVLAFGMFLLHIGVIASARADDAKKDSITVLPWTQATVVVTSEEKSSAAEYAQLFGGGWLLYVKASAPLDEDTRIAAFTTKNDFAKGFAGSLQMGIDKRAADSEALDRRMTQVALGLKALRSGQVGQQIPFDEWKRFFERHDLKPPGSSDAVKKWICSGDCAPKGDSVVARNICTKLGDRMCAELADDEAAKQAATVASGRYVNASCKTTLGLQDDQLDGCFLARFWLEERGLASAYAPIKELVYDTETMKLLWQILDLVDPGKAQELKKDKKPPELAQVLVDNIEVFQAAFRRAYSQAALARRDLLITGLLGTPKRARHAFTGVLDIEYDLLSVYQDDLAAAEPAEDSKYEWTVGGDYTLYTAVPGLALSFRAGGGQSRDPKAKKAERCKMFPSSDITVSGKNCDASALFRMGDVPNAKPTYFARAAITYQYGVGGSEDEVIPGAELRGGWKQEDGNDTVYGRLTLFATPIKGTTAARVGVALDVGYAINIGDADSRWNVTPLVFAGATFSQLSSSELW